jgi:hypothetical protein
LDCTELAFANMPTPKPAYLEIPPGVKLVNGKLNLRCSTGRVLTIDASTNASIVENGYVPATGTFDLTCGNGGWRMPPIGWPDEAFCLAGDPCTVTNVTVNQPVHIAIVSPAAPTTVNSGEFLVFGCSAVGKTLKLDFFPYQMECYNGNFSQSDKGADFPPLSACFVPYQCPLSQLTDLGYPPHLETTTTNVMNHGDKIHLTCTNSRRLRGDMDNKITLDCNDGVVSPPLSWPVPTDCVASCLTISVSPSAGFIDPSPNYTQTPSVDEGRDWSN